MVCRKLLMCRSWEAVGPGAVGVGVGVVGWDVALLLLIALFKNLDVFLLLSCESALRFVQVFDPFEGGEGVGQVCTGDVVLGVERHFVSLS